MAMTLRLDDDLDRTLQAIAEEQHISKHEAVIRAITEYAHRRAETRSQILARIVEQDADLLDLLAR